MPHVGPHEAEVRGKVARQGVGETAANQMHAAPPVAQQLDNRRKIVLGKIAERALQIGDGRFGERIDERALGVPRPGFARGLGERRGQLRLQFLAQLPLEIRIAEKSELGDKPQDGRRADPSAFGEFGHGRQSRRGIIRQQDRSGLALLRRQAADRRPDMLRNGSAIVDRRFNHADPSLG